MLRALLFSFPPLESDRKSFVKDVPIPKEPSRRDDSTHHNARRDEIRTLETYLSALFLDLQCFLNID